MPTIQQFNAYLLQLQNHDWYFEYSEDPTRWQKGNNNARVLNRQALEQPEFQQALTAFERCAYDTNRLTLNRRIVERDDTIEAIRRYIKNNEAVLA